MKDNKKIELPDCCSECPFFHAAIYGKCDKKDVWFGAEDQEWINDTTPNWCPMKDRNGKEKAE